MKYIIMCGGQYANWDTPRQLEKINGEPIVARTIRLLRENGIDDIAISADNPLFEEFGVPVLRHNNNYYARGYNDMEGDWFNAFYPTNEPTCYVFGDVVFSPEAIKKIVNTETDDMEFFGSKEPFASNYVKNHVEPFALKVVNTNHLKEAIEKTRELDRQGKFWRKPIMWELWTIIKDAPLQVRPNEYTAEYVAINDYTCDIDGKNDIILLQKVIGGKMIRLQATEDFTLKRFSEISKMERANVNKDDNGKVFKNDIFECNENLAEYVCGKNPLNRAVANILEVRPEVSAISQSPVEEIKKVEEVKVETAEYKTTPVVAPIKKTTKRSKRSKK